MMDAAPLPLQIRGIFLGLSHRKMAQAASNADQLDRNGQAGL
jgi:hypothetical protein